MFKTDNQTLNDLNIFGRRSENSVCGIFSHTHTQGGASLLEEVLHNPIDCVEKINARTAILQFFTQHRIAFEYRGEWFDQAEFYLSLTDSRTQLVASDNNLKRRLNNALGADTEYEQLHRGIVAILTILNTTQKILDSLRDVDPNYQPECRAMREIVEFEPFNLNSPQIKSRLTFEQVVYWDKLFRFKHREKLLTLLHYLYQMDLYCSIAEVVIERGFTFVKMYESDDNILEFTELRHPLVKDAVGNTLSVCSGETLHHMIFLTGANMAGKSTFMKSFGIAVYLAHCGLPVAADSMRLSVRDGLFTTINLPDNLNAGYSHFYAEVLRIKRIAQELADSQRLVVIFDELFRGTNVKDAYDATVAVMEEFSHCTDSTFLISTHIIEAGEELQKRSSDTLFVYLPTLMEGDRPRYTYKLTLGITSDRHGMVIIRNEGILKILESSHEN